MTNSDTLLLWLWFHLPTRLGLWLSIKQMKDAGGFWGDPARPPPTAHPSTASGLLSPSWCPTSGSGCSIKIAYYVWTLMLLFRCGQIALVEEGKLLFMEQYQLTHRGKSQLEDGHFATINRINKINWLRQGSSMMLKALGEKLTKNWNFARCQGTDTTLYLQKEVCNCIIGCWFGCCPSTQELELSSVTNVGTLLFWASCGDIMMKP